MTRQRGGTSTIQQALEQFLRGRGLAGNRERDRVFRAWRESLGQRSGRRARPVRFRDGELTVEVDSAALMSELRGFTGESYRQQANRWLEAELIRRVVFKKRV